MKTEQTKRRIVVIAGRPNDGKSAIFNRIAGGRVAIVHKQAGVTRDRLMKEVSWDDKRFWLIDTGGISSADGSKNVDAVQKGIKEQVEASLEGAAVVILVVDIEVGLMPLDLEVAGMLRERGCDVVVASNKADNSDRDKDAVEFDRLGFQVFPVSALHNRGFEDLMQVILEGLPEVDEVTAKTPLRVAVVGRPNVGKSSYVNRLLRSDRVIVSDIPGTTRDSIDVPFVIGKGAQARHYILIDTAGIRHVGKIDSSVERFGRFRAENSISNSDVVVMVLDADVSPTAQEKKIISLIIEEGKGCVIVVNKWDLAETGKAEHRLGLLRAMPFISHCPIVFTSAKTGYSIRRTVDVIDMVAAQTMLVIPTGILNRTIVNAYSKVHPPAIGGKMLKIYYATQVGCAPLRIRLFVNDIRIVADGYKAYIIRILRDQFGLEGAPVLLQFRARKNERNPRSRIRKK